MTPEQEEKLGAAMRELAHAENQRWRQRWGGSAKHSPSPYNLATSKLNGAKGGRPRNSGPLKMTVRTATINRMLQRGISIPEIADLLGATESSVEGVKSKYGLPREEDMA